MKYCSHCGTQLPDNAKFCTNCGAALDAAAAPTADKSKPKWLVPVIAVIAVAVGIGVGITAGRKTDVNEPTPTASSISEDEKQTQVESSPVPTEEPSPSPTPTEEPAAEIETGCRTMEDEPWKGAWCSDNDGSIMIFENFMNGTDITQTNADGSITIHRADGRDGVLQAVYTLSSDESTLEQASPEGEIQCVYHRPSYDMAPSPLPPEYWGAYQLVDYSMYNPCGPDIDFIVDAFRFGNCPYQDYVDKGNGAGSIYCPVAPEGFTVDFLIAAEVDGETYLNIFDSDGNQQCRFVRTAH